MKKTFFLKGIKDLEFDAMKDVLVNASLKETLVQICKKAQTLKPSSMGNSNRNTQHHQNNKQQKKNNKKKNKNKMSNTSGMMRDGRTFIPTDVWKLMSPKHKKLWNEKVVSKQEDSQV